MTTETQLPQATGSCCSSSGSARDGADSAAGAGAVTTVYQVSGMTCGHCEGAISQEISGIKGVTSVKAVASTGRVTVVSDAPLSEEDVRAAIDEAGYELVGTA